MIIVMQRLNYIELLCRFINRAMRTEKQVAYFLIALGYYPVLTCGFAHDREVEMRVLGVAFYLVVHVGKLKEKCCAPYLFTCKRTVQNKTLNSTLFL